MYQKTVRELALPRLISAGPETNLGQILEILSAQALNEVLIAAADNKVAGTVCERDILRGILSGCTLDSPAEKFLTPDAPRVGLDHPLGEAIKLMLAQDKRNLMVIGQNSELLGLLNSSHLVEALAVEFMCDNVECGQLMDREMLCFAPDVAVRELLPRLLETGKSGCVITADGLPLGLLTERDILLKSLQGGLGLDVPASRIMSSPALSVPDFGVVYKVILFMNQKNVRRLTVLGTDGKLVGLLGHAELLAYAENFF